VVLLSQKEPILKPADLEQAHSPSVKSPEQLEADRKTVWSIDRRALANRPEQG
jgi:hypothetical protein